ncbi:formate--tetrahydrofolate ligase [Corynebacterium kroppenstedtii]|uniref:formate--tetrahydrofolate ligase n=1 Tax=Corynebacterium sp. PCR 32 TaxID=3351342 RepID=UPI0030B2EE4F
MSETQRTTSPQTTAPDQGASPTSPGEPLSDVAIAHAHQLEPIADIARRAGIPDDALEPFGTTKAKVTVGKLKPTGAQGKVVLVTGMSPTPAGEGKSTCLIGLADGLTRAGVTAMAALREPSLGPVLGMKGGAAGGGYSQVVPMEDINLHFTGDMHAVTAANNALAALIDNHLHQGNVLDLDPRKIVWRRCLDVNDRVLRNVVVGLGGTGGGVPRESGFDITAASEVMAVLCLARDLADLRERLGRMLVGYTRDNKPVVVHDLGVEGALVALLREAMSPNLVQTLGGTPAFIHGGPFANIAHGCNSVIATNAARELADVVVTEAGFGADLGAEKFTNIASVAGGFDADVAVIVVTARSLKFNGGVARSDLNAENVEAVRAGLVNVAHHCASLRRLGMQPVVSVNKFTTDTADELAAITRWAGDKGIRVAIANVWSEGGAGAADLAAQVLEALEDVPVRSGAVSEDAPTRMYDPSLGVEKSISTIATDIYGAARVDYSPQAMKDLSQLTTHGWDTLPVCMSKTPYSLSDDPSALGAPKGHTLHVERLIPRLGPGFVVALTGTVFTMPGLPKKPAAMEIDVADEGSITGLF